MGTVGRVFVWAICLIASTVLQGGAAPVWGREWRVQLEPTRPPWERAEGPPGEEAGQPTPPADTSPQPPAEAPELPPAQPPAQAEETPREDQTLVPEGMPPGEEEGPAAGDEAPEEQVTVSLAQSVQELIRARFPDLVTTVSADVDENLVELYGTTDRLSRSIALQDAVQNLPGNKLVVNRIEVKAPERSDRIIAAEVRGLLRANESLGDLPIDVRVEDQVVFLEGRVPTEIFEELAREQAAEVAGVRAVESRLRTAL